MADLDELYNDGKKAGDIQDQLNLIIKDIAENKNLDIHLKDINSSIREVDKSIQREKLKGGKIDSLEDLKEGLLIIKNTIIERISKNN